jgi:hypothetical protein
LNLTRLTELAVVDWSALKYKKAAIIAAFLHLSETASDAVFELVVEQVGVSFVGAANRLTDRIQSYRAFG